MSSTDGPRPHLGTDDLIRYIDRQLPLREARHARDHVEGCADCAVRVEEMRAGAEEVSRWLTAVDLPVNPVRRSAALQAVERARFRRPIFTETRVGLTAAAAVLVLLLGGLGTRPGRTLIAEGVESWSGDPPGPMAAAVLDWLGHPPGTLAGATDALADPIPERPESIGPERRPAEYVLPPGAQPPMFFDAPGPDIVLRFRTRQEAGTATLWFRDVERASGQVTAGSGGEELTQSPDGLEVRNGRGSEADYMIVVPVRFRTVRIQVAGEPEVPIRITKSKLDGLWTISLREGS